MTGPRLNGRSGLTKAEASIMESWDAGASAQRIAEATGLDLKRVRAVIATFDGGSEVRCADAAIRADCARYAAALAATGRRYA